MIIMVTIFKTPSKEFWDGDSKTLIDKLKSTAKSEGKGVLLLSGGDINTGTPESDFFDAEPDFRAMNMMGYDAMSIGNHEFDNPFKTLLKQQSWSKFPFLAANIYYSKGKKKFNSSVIEIRTAHLSLISSKWLEIKKFSLLVLQLKKQLNLLKLRMLLFGARFRRAKTLL